MKMKKIESGLVALIVMLFTFVSADAVMSHFVTISGTATVTPAPEVLQQSWLEGNTTGCTGVYHNCDDEHIDKNLTQSFVPTKNGLITKAGLFLTRHSGSSSVNLTVQISGNTNSTCKSGSINCPNSTIIASGTITSFNGTSDDYSWKNVTFTSPVLLSSGKIYHLVILDAGGDVYRWAKDKTAPVYSSGQKGISGPSGWDMKNNEAFIFKAYMQVGP